MFSFGKSAENGSNDLKAVEWSWKFVKLHLWNYNSKIEYVSAKLSYNLHPKETNNAYLANDTWSARATIEAVHVVPIVTRSTGFTRVFESHLFRAVVHLVAERAFDRLDRA